MIRFRESLRGFSFANLRDIVSSKAVDIKEWLKAPEDFFNTRNGKTNATFRQMISWQKKKKKTVKKKRKNNQ